MTCSAKENILDTLMDSFISSHINHEDLEQLAEDIAVNLDIKYEKFPKWQ